MPLIQAKMESTLLDLQFAGVLCMCLHFDLGENEQNNIVGKTLNNVYVCLKIY